MGNWTHSITAVNRDPVNFNVVVDITYTDDSNPPRVYVDRRWPLGIVPANEVAARIDEQARRRIKNVFEIGDLALAVAQGIADGKPRTLPPDPVVDSAAQQKQVAFQLALQAAAQLKYQQSIGINVTDAEVTAAVDAANSAKAALSP